MQWADLNWPRHWSLVMWWGWTEFAFVECEFWLQNLSNANVNRGINFIGRNIMHWFRSSEMIVTICYFLKSVKSVFILVQCNTSLSKNYIAHSVTVVCVIGWIWGKKQVCLHSLALYAYEISCRTRIFPRIRIRQKALKTFLEFWICWKRSKLEQCWIRIWTSSHPYWPWIDILASASTVTTDSRLQCRGQSSSSWPVI